MPYAVLQMNLNAPSIEQLQRAFRFVEGLTPYDARILGNDAFGILVKDLSAKQAGALQGALRSEGLETEIVDQSHLPAIPPTHFVHRCEPSPEHLLIYDPAGRSFALEWPHVLIVAAGAVRLTEFVQQRKQRPVTRYRGDGVQSVEIEYDTVSKEEQNFRLLCEIIVTGGALRYSVTAEKLNFSYLGERNMGNPVANFSLFVRDLVRFSSHCYVNRGAEVMQNDATKAFSYPSKNAFYEEIVWMLWQLKKAA